MSILVINNFEFIIIYKNKSRIVAVLFIFEDIDNFLIKIMAISWSIDHDELEKKVGGSLFANEYAKSGFLLRVH